MERFWIPFFSLLAVIIQTTLLPSWFRTDMTPNLVLLMVLFLALQKSTTIGLWLAFALGLLQDIAGGGPMGLNSLILVTLVYLVSYVRKQFFKENVTAQIIIVLGCTLVQQFLAFFWMNTIMHTQFGFKSWWTRALLLSIIHALLAPLLFQWLAKFIHGENIFKHLINHSRSRFGIRK